MNFSCLFTFLLYISGKRKSASNWPKSIAEPLLTRARPARSLPATHPAPAAHIPRHAT